MGLFSSKKKISVSSVTYNLAGDEKDRIQYLPTLIATAVIGKNNASLGDEIKNGMLSGPGIKMRSFARWARTQGYSTAIGLQSGQLLTGNSIDTNALIGQLSIPAGKSASIHTADIGAADYGYWADQWMAINHPTEVEDDYEVDFDELINTIYIRFPGGAFYSFSPTGLDPLSQYLYVSYTIVDGAVVGPLVTGDTVSIGSSSEYPDTVDWDDNGTTSTPGSLDLEETVYTVISYSDGRPDEITSESTPSTGSYFALTTTYSRTVYQGQMFGLLDAISSTLEIQYNMATGVIVEDEVIDISHETIEDDVVKTTTVTTTTESVGTAYSYRIDTQETIEKAWSTIQVMIYQRNSGNVTLDAMFAPDVDAGVFLPFVPMRISNTFLSDTFLPDIYEDNVKAYKRAVGKKYDALVDIVKDNPSIGDVDHAYIVYGVSLNTAENSSKKYVYKFFQNLMQQGAGGIVEFDAWQVQWGVADLSLQTWNTWKEAQADPLNPLFGAEEPTQIPYPALPNKSIRVFSNSLNFNFILGWSSMEEVTGTGLGKPDAKVGHLWWTQGSTITYEERAPWGKEGDIGGLREVVVEYVSLHWQDGPDSHRTISMWGLTHSNVVYKGKAVGISAKDALNDLDSSGFLIPLHEGILKTMSLKDSTQMTTACTHIVFNSYEVTKQKWYTTTIFKVILIVIIIIISIFYPPFAATAPGLLGTAAAVGTALGFAGTIAIIVGTIANAIAAMILTKIITAGATALFGEKVGEIVGAIASVIAVAYGSGTLNTASMSAGFSSLATAQNLMKLTMSVGSGYADYMQTAAQDVLGQTEDLLNSYKAETQAIVDAFNANLGGSNIQFDPTALTDAANFIPETPNSFLSRTLMTGSDIAEISHSMLTNFAAMTITTGLPA